MIRAFNNAMLGYSRNLQSLHPSPFTIHNSQFTIHNSQFTIHNSQFTIKNHPSPNCSNILATFTCSFCHSSSQVESNTTPPPAQTCAPSSLATTVRIKILKSTKPESSKKPSTPQ